jgi:hypothetical protein
MWIHGKLRFTGILASLAPRYPPPYLDPPRLETVAELDFYPLVVYAVDETLPP